MRRLIALLAQLPPARQSRLHPLGGDPDGIASPRPEQPDASRPSAFWRCPVAGCSFAALNRMMHPCPLPPAVSGTPVVTPAAPVDRADPTALPRVLAGLRAMDSVPAPPLEPTAEDFGAALAAWGPAADTVRTLPRPMAGVGV